LLLTPDGKLKIIDFGNATVSTNKDGSVKQMLYGARTIWKYWISAGFVGVWMYSSSNASWRGIFLILQKNITVVTV